jgi:hypothetical protein
MPRIQRADLPRRFLEHLYEQALARKLRVEDLLVLRHWLDSCPEVPHGPWLKRFPGFILCGACALPRTILVAGGLPWGPEVK